MLTLQHLSFEDYFTGTNEAQQREWAKVQGRFEDIPYSESPSQTRTLITTVFDIHDEHLKGAVVDWSCKQAKIMAALEVTDLADANVVAGCYPLDPLSAAVLPELCSRFGQNERTLFSFLTGADPAGVAAFLSRTSWKSEDSDLPSVGLAQIYDYFVGSGSVSIVSGALASRWTEVTTRLRDTIGLTADQEELAKAVAVLNLVSIAGTLRASIRVLRMVLPNAEDVLSELEEMGLVTYREFADEYRIWQGSDIDLRRLLDDALARGQHQRLTEIVVDVDAPSPMVAARHSAQHDVLRVFSRRYIHGDELIESLNPFSEVDGEVLLVIGKDRQCPTLTDADGPTKPMVVAIPHDIAEFEDAARFVAAIQSVIDDPAVSEDWVARRELSERLAQAQVAFDAINQTAFTAEHCDWLLLAEGGVTRLEGGRGSASLSEAADLVYSDTPNVGNEMLNRSDVTAQGAKARRLLLEAMLEHADEDDLGFSGYGPEVAMYRSFLQKSGIHRLNTSSRQMTFDRPDKSSLLPAWKVLEKQFARARKRRVNLNDVYAALMSPPIGMKAAVVPVFITSALITSSAEVAIYEHGTFKPVLSPDVSERMVRNPGHFDIKHFATSTGERREVVERLAESLGVQPRFRKHRVGNVLAIVGHLVAFVTKLDNYTRRTENLSAPTCAVRDALLTAVEPDELLFDLLPRAFGLPKIGSTTKAYRSIDALVEGLGSAVVELEGAYEEMLRQLTQDLFESCGESTRLVLTGWAASLTDEVLDPEIRSFVLALGNDTVEHDRAWIQTIATVLSKKAPAEWTDEDRKRYGQQLPIAMSAFQRLLALHVESRIASGEAFDAMRVTFTQSDGREIHRLVAVEKSDRAAAEGIMLAAVRELENVTGSTVKAQQALLAVLGERFMPSVIEVGEGEVSELTEAKVSDG